MLRAIGISNTLTEIAGQGGWSSDAEKSAWSSGVSRSVREKIDLTQSQGQWYYM